MKRMPRINYANVMATLGVFLALGGTSYAAVKIDGSNVKDGSLTGRDIKDRSIAPRDLKKKITGKRGRPGARGPRGATGPKGQPGENGSGFATFVRGNPVAEADRSSVTVATLEVPAGHWVLMASGTLENQATGGNLAECALRAGQDPSDAEIFTSTHDLFLEGKGNGSGANTESFSIVGAVSMVTPGIVELQCRSESGPVKIRRSLVTAVEAAKLTDQTDESGFPA